MCFTEPLLNIENKDKPKAPEFVFRPKARLMELLGEQLIKNHNIALFELVKNGYDADASKVEITLLEINSKEDGVIEVQDDGDGMSFETVTQVWLEPANKHKADFRDNGNRTKKNRSPIGEKGVGRFAVQRLGTQVEMVTKSKGEDEVVVSIDWDDFLKNEYLDEAGIQVKKRTPKVFKKSSTGTRITISGLRTSWKRGDVRKLYRSVSSMTPPDLNPTSENIDLRFKSKEVDKQNTFTVDLNLLPNQGWLEGLFSPETATSNALFVFDFEISDEGMKYVYQYKPYEAIIAEYPKHISKRSVPKDLKDLYLDVGHGVNFFKYEAPELKISKAKNFKKRKDTPKLGRRDKDNPQALGIGKVKGRILGFDFDQDIYERYIKDETGGLVDYVRDNGGIRIYRDSLRVYNYGEPNDDWLQLDHRRVQSPTRRFGARQLMGAIHLDLNDSNELIENTNREGFVENAALEELRHIMMSVLNEFEVERNKDKSVLKKILRYPPGEVGLVDPKKSSNVERLIDDLRETVASNKIYRPLVSHVDRVDKAYSETRDALMSAAGAGLGLVTVFHELERGVRGLHHSIMEGIEPVKLELMSTELISVLEGAMYMVSVKQFETISASRLLNYVLLTQEGRFKKHGITFLNGFSENKSIDFEIKGVRRILTSVLVNLLDNAIYWVDFKGEKEKYIWVGTTDDLDGPAIVIADSGDGFRDTPEDVIAPFFTRRETGMGIGLYFADMAMKSHSGRLSFPEQHAIEVPKVAVGARVAMVFKGDN